MQKNPLTMIGEIEKCWLFAYQTPRSDAQALLPEGFEAVTLGDFAFYNIVVSKIKSMRPLQVPSWLGVTYWHVAYRLYVRIYPKNQEPIEGLYFLRSECDNQMLSVAGNMMTDFNFHYATIKVEDWQALTRISISASGEKEAKAVIDRNIAPQLSEKSAFDSLEHAQTFLKYKANGLSSTTNSTANVVTITRVEDQWRSKIVHVSQADWPFMNGRDASFEICYEVEPISYQWNAGRSVTLRE